MPSFTHRFVHHLWRSAARPHGWALALLAAALGGCANYATLQDPETMPDGEFQVGVGATFNAYPLEIETTTTTAAGVETTELSRETFTVPALTLSGRYGLSDRLELHGIAWLPFGASIGGKYMVAGDRAQGGFAFSPGVDVSVPMTVTINDESATFMDFYVPLQMGYRTSASFAAYWAPKYVLRLVGGELGHAAGGTVGIAIGEKTQFMVEGGVLYDTVFTEPIFSGAIGLGFM